uniref:Uncharacterized protein n=2 Tax=Opuntia streptacantha TaxID=393608 RepID=A0A7C9DVQ1_OPUST
MSSLGAKEPQPKTKAQKEHKIKTTKQDTSIYKINTQNENTTSPNKLTSHTYKQKQQHQRQLYTKPITPPITTHNYTQRQTRLIIAHWAQQIPNFTSKLITHTKRNLKYPQL